MKKSLIRFAESIPIREQRFPAPYAIHLYRSDDELRASIAPGLSLISGSCLPGREHDRTILEWMDWWGGYEAMGYQLSPDLSLSLYWDTACWNCPGVGARRNCQYFVQIERPSRETWLWCGEPIARRLFAEAFGMASGLEAASEATGPRSPLTAEQPLVQAIHRTTAVMPASHTASTATVGWDFAAISAVSMN